MQTSQKIGVVLLNMGGPTDIYGVEDFLKSLFNDPLILPIKNSFIRKIVSNFIAKKRLQTAKQNYQAIGGGSPINQHTFNLIQKLNKMDPTRFYAYAMRYAPPLTKDVLEDFKNQGINDIILFSMYPQYSSTTILSSLIEVYKNLKLIKYEARVKVIEQFYEYLPFYELIVDEIQRTLGNEDSKNFTLILSTHSLPQSIVDKGDPYPIQCQKGQQIITEICKKRGLNFEKIALTYQSKIGRMKWLEPSTNEYIKQSKDKKLIIYPIAFSIDNSETDYELRIQYADIAQKNQIKDYRVCPCMNDSKSFAQMIVNLINEKYPTVN